MGENQRKEASKSRGDSKRRGEAREWGTEKIGRPIEGETARDMGQHEHVRQQESDNSMKDSKERGDSKKWRTAQEWSTAT